MDGSEESAFLDLLYAAAARPELWIPVMERFGDLTGGAACWLSRLDQRTGAGSGVTTRVDPASTVLYEQYYAKTNPFTNLKDPLNIAVAGRPLVTTDEDRIPRDQFVRSEYYNDFLGPHDIHATLMIGLSANGFEGSMINLGRPASRGRFERPDLDVARRLHPHLIRAFSLSERLTADRALDLGAGVVFNRSPHSLVQLDRAGKVLRINPAGEALLRGDCGLTVQRGRLVARSTDDARRFGALIAAAAALDPEKRIGGSMALATPGRALPLSIIIAPLRLDSSAVFHDQPSVLVCVSDLEAHIGLSERRLRDLFQFTPAEARLAIALHGGATSREAAASLGISINTVNVQMARLFAKTGVNRQSALARLLNRAEGLHLG